MSSKDGLPTAWGSSPTLPSSMNSSLPPGMGTGQPPAPSGQSDWMAYASFGLGLASCGFWCLTGVPAIVLGVGALSRVTPGAKVFAVFGILFGAFTTLISIAFAGLMAAGVASMASLTELDPYEQPADYGDYEEEDEPEWTDE